MRVIAIVCIIYAHSAYSFAQVQAELIIDKNKACYEASSDFGSMNRGCIPLKNIESVEGFVTEGNARTGQSYKDVASHSIRIRTKGGNIVTWRTGVGISAQTKNHEFVKIITDAIQ